MTYLSLTRPDCQPLIDAPIISTSTYIINRNVDEWDYQPLIDAPIISTHAYNQSEHQ